MTARFTIDGSEALEQFLKNLCAEVLAGTLRLVPENRVDALVLGGGYGRGQGGVLRTPHGDHPYNDIEFYLFLSGSRLLNERRYGPALHDLADSLSRKAGLQVEFKIESMARFRRAPVSMFSYDLVAGHHVLQGPPEPFRGCSHHMAAGNIPLSEATRLLFNRCTGLLLASELLQGPNFSPEDADFVNRNLHKARLAFGDAVLTAFGMYDWDCRERHRRLCALPDSAKLRLLGHIREHHLAGVEFKLHPQKLVRSPRDFLPEHAELLDLGREVWLWLEGRRFRRQFASLWEYVAFPARKCPEAAVFRNLLLNVRSFGWDGALGILGFRYPRERLFNSLPVLLWNEHGISDPGARRHLQRQLNTRAIDWNGFVAAYKNVWPAYG